MQFPSIIGLDGTYFPPPDPGAKPRKKYQPDTLNDNVHLGFLPINRGPGYGCEMAMNEKLTARRPPNLKLQYFSINGSQQAEHLYLHDTVSGMSGVAFIEDELDLTWVTVDHASLNIATQLAAAFESTPPFRVLGHTPDGLRIDAMTATIAGHSSLRRPTPPN
jgi:hypothetical protein